MGVGVSINAVGDTSVSVSVGSRASVGGTCVGMDVEVGGASVSEGETTSSETSACGVSALQAVTSRPNTIVKAAGYLHLIVNSLHEDMGVGMKPVNKAEADRIWEVIRRLTIERELDRNDKTRYTDMVLISPGLLPLKCTPRIACPTTITIK